MNHAFQFGDRVRHASRPEWGVGSVMKVENATVNGETAQRLSIRFPNAGVKTLSTSVAPLERVQKSEPMLDGERPSVADLDKMHESGWLSSVAEKKIQEVMTELPLEVRDPFNGHRGQLDSTLRLFRFDRSGRGLIDWAVAQSGLDDPLSRFTRPELEQLYDRWVMNRDAQLKRLLQESESTRALLEELLNQAPRAARTAVQRISAAR